MLVGCRVLIDVVLKMLGGSFGVLRAEISIIVVEIVPPFWARYRSTPFIVLTCKRPLSSHDGTILVFVIVVCMVVGQIVR